MWRQGGGFFGFVIPAGIRWLEDEPFITVREFTTADKQQSRGSFSRLGKAAKEANFLG